MDFGPRLLEAMQKQPFGGTLMPSNPSMLDRFRGSLLGLAIGDAVGCPFEAMDGYSIYKAFGPSLPLVENPPVDALSYTDDTEMMIGLAEHLVEHGQVEPDALIQRFAQHYDPRRGYGQGAKRLLQAVREGQPWRPLAETLFPGGSLGNGGAMRVAPVGLLFHRDFDLVERDAIASASVTHQHPIGIDGARVLALAVAIALQPEKFDRAAFFEELYARSTTDEIQTALARAATAGPDFAPMLLGDGVEAHRSVVTAIACFDQQRDSYVQTLAAALRVGGDTDTIAAMAGAIAGARLVSKRFPRTC